MENKILHVKSEMQVIHARMHIVYSRTPREGGRRIDEWSSTRPPRGDQVDGLPRVVNPRKCEPKVKGHALKMLVVISKIEKVLTITFGYREQILKVQLRRTVWSGSRLRLCVVSFCTGGLKTVMHMLTLVKNLKILKKECNASIIHQPCFPI